MSNHDKYDNDILKQLTRIANSLDRIERKMPLEKDKNYYITSSWEDNPVYSNKAKEVKEFWQML